jgi:hypothetical protein
MIRVAGGDESGIGDEQHSAGAELAHDFPDALDGIHSKDQAGARLEIKWRGYSFLRRH